ncbi:EAL domain-containing protein (putative c-di-GMP-specific phosphodiesterase class I) [Rhodovulum imhoffii]|uniref:EAL domain-containing protein (Putative c-di-GMP-specific phosphodiesterase class I) n=1 Tax=Rhodovulum imhoffii TaxID=365340 RepID=A0A2T5BUN2_9RHOB|nr:EAL domain-containing protein [Rhodovulum imhoffii]MBK5934816.1 diguanylate phosphodiesterase [Rhodovulum imhoffii]PTN03218.1 EAL domain-containing protein (putative c-di-GMP-specific phosphodiesterase class I) [Rhodovulum imhoffii]
MNLPEDSSFPVGGESPLDVANALRAADAPRLVREAVSRKDVTLAYQPVVTAGEGYIAFYEGLVRVFDTQGRAIPARHFIDSVETTEIGRRIDCLALEKGLRALAETPDLRLSINLSARSIAYPDWMKTLNRGLAIDPTAAERLILEITESSAMTVPDLVSVFMRDLQARGIAFALDDFGAGYTALRYLRNFYFDILKIDGQFIQNIHADADNQVLTGAILSIARQLDMLTVAENVEKSIDAAYLIDAGVDCLQGYAFAAPTLSPPWLATREQLRA